MVSTFERFLNYSKLTSRKPLPGILNAAAGQRQVVGYLPTIKVQLNPFWFDLGDGTCSDDPDRLTGSVACSDYVPAIVPGNAMISKSYQRS